jgi:hypothetical protein
MVKKLILFGIILSIFLGNFQAYGQEEKKTAPTLPPARKIPGIIIEDPYPHGCVDCHINYVDMKLDTRFSTLMKLWSEKVEPKLVAKAQASAPKDLMLKGKHPNADAALKDIPAGCIVCHGKESSSAPPFANMIHNIHLIGGEENHFMTMFQGECTYCHKLDLTTGHWSMPSGPEK